MLEPHHRYIENAGVRLSVSERYPADGPDGHPCIIMVHGYPDSSVVWDAVASNLADRYHVVTYDVRGAGLSDAPRRTRDYRLAHLSADLQAVMDAVSPDQPVHLVAHDWGSIQTWESVTDPQLAHRIASFTSLSGPCLDHVGFWMADRVRHPNRERLEALFHQLAHSWYIGLFHLPVIAPAAWSLWLDKQWPDILRRTEGIRAEPVPTQLKDGKHGIKLYRANMLPRLLRPRKRYAQCPVQLLVADHDAYVTAGLLSDLERWVPNLTREHLDASHWVVLKHPLLISKRIHSFVKRVSQH